jgi:uncharacterized protein DUF4397
MTSRIRTRRVAAIAIATLALVAVGLVGPAQADAHTAKRSAAAAYVRAAHLSPDTGGVDVYLTAFSGGTQRLWLSDVGYGDVSTYRRLTPGLYAVSMRPHNAPSTTKPALTWSVNLGAGRAYTAAAIGENAALHGVVYDDALAGPAAGHALVRVVQASSRAGHVKVLANGQTLTADCAFGCTTPYRTVASGHWSVDAQSASGAAASARAQVTVASREILTVVVLDAKSGGVLLHPLVDAAGAAVAPNGAVPAGGGGTAPRPGGNGAIEGSLVGIAALALSVGVGAVWRRRRTAPVA